MCLRNIFALFFLFRMIAFSIQLGFFSEETRKILVLEFKAKNINFLLTFNVENSRIDFLV